jgi:hypothetical protein
LLSGTVASRTPSNRKAEAGTRKPSLLLGSIRVKEVATDCCMRRLIDAGTFMRLIGAEPPPLLLLLLLLLIDLFVSVRTPTALAPAADHDEEVDEDENDKETEGRPFLPRPPMAVAAVMASDDDGCTDRGNDNDMDDIPVCVCTPSSRPPAP